MQRTRTRNLPQPRDGLPVWSGTEEGSKTIKASVFRHLEKLAKLDAKIFVSEFCEPFDPANTTWDSEAFWQAWRSACAVFSAYDIADLRDQGYEYYSSKLRSATLELCGVR